VSEVHLGKRAPLGVQHPDHGVDHHGVKAEKTTKSAPVEGHEDMRFGIRRYGGPIPVDAKAGPSPATAAEAAKQVLDLTKLATEYLKAGKRRIAEDILQKAEEAAQTLSVSPKDLQIAQSAIQKLTEKLSKSKVTKAREVLDAGSKTEKKKMVMVFGLSANPPTGAGGHVGIVRWGSNDLKVDLPNDRAPELAREQVGIDEVWVLPVFKHAFASKSNLLPFEHRVAMAKLAFEEPPDLKGRVRVVETEREVVEDALEAAKAKGDPLDKVRVGSIDILRRLIEEHPDTQFVLALGGDTYADLRAGKWKEGDTLQELVPIVVVPREGVANVEGTERNGPVLTDISSTKVRGSTDLDFLKTALEPSVLKYILENELYSFAPVELASEKRTVAKGKTEAMPIEVDQDGLVSVRVSGGADLRVVLPDGRTIPGRSEKGGSVLNLAAKAKDEIAIEIIGRGKETEIQVVRRPKLDEAALAELGISAPKVDATIE
jgi:nicotinate-nucleotide adenylyltransferase